MFGEGERSKWVFISPRLRLLNISERVKSKYLKNDLPADVQISIPWLFIYLSQIIKIIMTLEA